MASNGWAGQDGTGGGGGGAAGSIYYPFPAGGFRWIWNGYPRISCIGQIKKCNKKPRRVSYGGYTMFVRE